MAAAVCPPDPDYPPSVSSSLTASAIYSQEQHFFTAPRGALISSLPHHDAIKPGGPPFGNTIVHQLVVTSSGKLVRPTINALIPKGFFQVDKKWTCYRRNYFQLTCSFELKPKELRGPFYIRQQGEHLEPINEFSVLISAKTATANHQESEKRGLVQHTPKRDKATEHSLKRQPIRPLEDVPLSSTEAGESAFDTPTAQTFERVQFQKATANNGKRRAAQQYFQVVVELIAESGAPGAKRELVLLATCESSPIVVRGRSPGHYKPYQPSQPPTSVIDLDLPTLSPEDNFFGQFANERRDLSINKRSATFEREDKAFSDSSVSSVADQFSILTTGSSATSAPDLSSPLDDIVRALLEDNGIRCLCVDSFAELDGLRFERNLRRLLKHFANDLCRKATGHNEIHAAVFFRRKAVHVARLIRDACSGTSRAVDAPLVEQAPPWVGRVQDVAVGPGALKLPSSDLDDLVSEDDEGEGLPDLGPEDVTAHDMISSIHFFTKGDAFMDFRESLMDFVVPFMARVWHSRYQVPDGDIMMFLQQRYEGKHHQNPRPNAATSGWISQLHPYLPFSTHDLKSISSFVLSFARQALQAFGRRLRPRIRPGYYRAEWVCECGDLLWADFETAQPNLWLTELNPTVIQVTNTSAFAKTVPTSPSSDGPGSIGFTGTSEASPVASFNRATSSSISQNANTGRSTSSSTDAARYRASSANLSRYLEICVNTGEYEISLAEIKINNHGSPAIRSDGDLFREISNAYDTTRYRLLTHKLGLFKPARVDYVEVRHLFVDPIALLLTLKVLRRGRHNLHTPIAVSLSLTD
jgi:hypothetical protein